MNTKLVVPVVIVVVLLAGAWFGRDAPAMRRLVDATGLANVLPSGDATPSTASSLAAAGVHKCQTSSGIVYIDRACPKGSRELAADGGAVTVMTFPKAAPPVEPGASGGVGSRLVKGVSNEERDRLRDRQIEDAANR